MSYQQYLAFHIFILPEQYPNSLVADTSSQWLSLLEYSLVLTVLVILFDHNKENFHYSCRYYMLKVNNQINRIKCKTCLKLTVKAPERRQ